MLFLAACGLTPSKPPPSDVFHGIPYKAPAMVLKKTVLKGVLGVERPQTDGTHDDRAILYTDADRPYSLQKHIYHFWQNSPTILLQERMYHYLSNATFATKVVRFDAGVHADYILSSRLVKFERLVSKARGTDQVIIGIELRITDANYTKEVVQNKYYEFKINSERHSDINETMHASVVAFGKAFGMTMDKFVADNVRKLSGQPGTKAGRKRRATVKRTARRKKTTQPKKQPKKLKPLPKFGE